MTACDANLTLPPDRGRVDAGLPPPPPCVPNLDGLVESSEVAAAIGVPTSFLISPSGEEQPVDIAGKVDSSGHRVWDLGVERQSDQTIKVTAASLAGKWYADSFPGGQFTLPVDTGGSLDGVYAQDATALRLLGMASASASPPEGQTILPYVTPVPLYRFPLGPDAEWTAVGEVQGGIFRGLPYAGRDVYEIRVDGSGTLILPDLTFTQAHRVRLRVTVAPAVGASSSRRQVSFVFECFGEVARVSSRSNEPEEDFTVASEVRRLGL